MSRITPPVSKLVRSINSAATNARSSSLLDSHYNVNQGAVLMPKYAELLKNRTRRERDSARTLTTTHRPTPQPTRSTGYHRQMQTFSTPASAPATLASIDFTALPTFRDTALPADDFAAMRMPLLPDSFTTTHRAHTSHSPSSSSSAPDLSKPVICVVAAHPENVTTAAALTEVEAFGVDGVELKWAHDPDAADTDHQPGLRGLLQGFVDTVVASHQKPAF